MALWSTLVRNMLTRSHHFKSTSGILPSQVPSLVVTKSEVVDEKVAVKSHAADDEVQKGSDEWRPPNWQQLLANIRLMRSAGDAPVDTVGCEKCVNPDADPKIRRFEVLVSLMLSSQTRDEVTHAACERLRDAALSPQMILDIDPDKLGDLIKPVGFWRKKVVYLKKVSELLLKEYDGDIPDTVDGLCSLPGVGPKMSHLAMQVAWGQVTGIAVDTHVHRICNRLNFVKKSTKDPIQTEKQIEDWLPRDRWPDFNSQLVGFGQLICTPRYPKCHQCLNQNICPSAHLIKKAVSKSK